MRMHLRMPIKTALKHLRSGKNIFNDQMGIREAIESCEELLAKGRVYITSEGCNNYDKEGTCLGH